MSRASNGGLCHASGGVIGFELGRLLLGRLVGAIEIRALHHLSDLEIGLAGIQNADFIHHHAGFDPAIRTLDKSVFVDPSETRERADQSDVRTFRSFDRTDSSVVRGVHVTDFETRAFA